MMTGPLRPRLRFGVWAFSAKGRTRRGGFCGSVATVWQTLCFIEITSVKLHGKTIGHWGLTSHHPLRSRRHHAPTHAIPAAAFSFHQCLDKIVLQHHKLDANEPENLLQSILRVVENNGEVTLPKSAADHRRAWGIALIAGLTLAGLGFLIFFSLR